MCVCVSSELMLVLMSVCVCVCLCEVLGNSSGEIPESQHAAPSFPAEAVD